MKIVLGIGNPGAQYRGTRHNVGYMVLDVLSRRFGVKSGRSRFRAVTAEITVGEQKALLVKPVTYVNLSGFAAAAALTYYDLDLEDFLVVCDDMNLPPGRIRVRKGGSSGGHNGLQSVADAVHTEDFPRLRVGIGTPARDGVDHVLGRFSKDETVAMKQALEHAADTVETWVTEGIEPAMNTFNAPQAGD